MKLNCFLLFHLMCSVFALTQDQIFQNDWQTVNIGVPVATVEIDDRIITFSELGVFAILNSTTGGLLYRYQSELSPASPSSGLTKGAEDDHIINYINFESTSKLLVWNVSRHHGIIQNEFDIKNNIIAVTSRDDHIYVVDKHTILDIDLKTNSKSEIHSSSDAISNAKLFSSTLDKSVYAIFEINDKVYFTSYSNFELKPFSNCPISKTRFQQSTENLLICDNTDVYAFDSFSLQKFHTGKNMVDDKLSADSLVDSPLKSFEVVNNDEIFAFSESSISLFNRKSLGFTPDSVSEIPVHIYDSEYHLFSVSHSNNNTDINLFIVTPSLVLEYYRNGKLLWRNDQSFVVIKDLIIVDSALKSSLTTEELIYDTSSNVFVSFIRRLRHNYNSIFGKSKFALDDVNRFGMSKNIVALSENGKIAVFKMYKDVGSIIPQLTEIFTPPIKFTNLYEIDRKVYALSDNMKIFEVDIVLGKIHLISPEFEASNFRTIKKSETEIEIIKTPSENIEEFYTTSFSELKNTIKGHLFNTEGQVNTWKFSPLTERIVSLTKRSYGNQEVAQRAIELPDRSALYKYLIPNIGVITTSKESQQGKYAIFYLVNLITGQTYGKFEKEVGLTTDIQTEVHASFEENYIVLTTPDKFSRLDTQICSIDLFEALKPDQSTTKGIDSYSSFENTILPSFALQCFILPGVSVEGLAISHTKHNIATKNIIIRTSLGQVIALPKMIVDGRRNGIIGDFNTQLSSDLPVVLLNGSTTSSPLQRINTNVYATSIASKFTYEPIININPQSILTHHRKLVSAKNGRGYLLTKPTELESTTYVLSVDGDIFVTFIRPSGSFDRLTSSFNTKVVICTLVVLLLGIAFVRPKTEKMKLLGKWIL